jgi:polyphosphate kinase 2 (PPK2 family)
MSHLADADLTSSLSRKDYEQQLEEKSWRLAQLRLALGGRLGDAGVGPGLLVLFEGWDASGKGGAIKRLVAPLDARHVRVVQYAAPSPDEKRHFYLQRFVDQLPGLGGMVVFDRTWYGRVLVERVEGFATTEQWQRAYAEIIDFERMLHLEGVILVKFWMHISADEQLARFKAREKDPLKQWKLTDEDWRNREKLPEYTAAVEEMLERTDTTWAPWYVVPAESKKFARIAVIDAVIKEIERGCAHLNFPLPPPREEFEAGHAGD